MKVMSLVYVIFVLVTINALRTASFSGAMVSVTTMPDIEFSQKRITQLSQLRIRAMQSITTNTTIAASNSTISNTTSANITKSNTTATVNITAGNSTAKTNITTNSTSSNTSVKNSSDSFFRVFYGLSLVLISLFI